jgi:hypothetical protein
MSQLKFNCSHCEQRLECDEQFAGRQITCPACQGLTLVPAVSGKAAPALPKSGMTFVPESWKKPASSKTPPSPQKTGMTSVPETWQPLTPPSPPPAGAE